MNVRPRRLRRLVAAACSVIVLAGCGVGACARPAIAEQVQQEVVR